MQEDLRSNPRPAAPKGRKSNSLLTVAIIIIVAVVGALLFSSQWSKEISYVNGEYQAVFLTNGQVYFGKIEKLTSKFAILDNIYYLQLRKPLQNQQQGTEEELAAQQQSQLTLIKLGRELHGPLDQMTINRDHILFIEGLKDDSSVVKAIAEYKKSQEQKPADDAATTK